jgi:tetratricopeptide (TPR) repeat protein
LSAKGDIDRAIEDYSAAIRLDTNYAVPHNGRGNAWRRKGDLDRAIADFTDAIRLDTNYANAYTNRGAVYERLGRKAEAIADFRKAVSIAPSLQQSIDGLKRLDAVP